MLKGFRKFFGREDSAALQEQERRGAWRRNFSRGLLALAVSGSLLASPLTALASHGPVAVSHTAPAVHHAGVSEAAPARVHEAGVTHVSTTGRHGQAAPAPRQEEMPDALTGTSAAGMMLPGEPLPLGVMTAGTKAPLPDSVRSITADAAILMNAKTGEVLYSKNGDKREYPASMTKMMTCILSVESGRPDMPVTITPMAADVESTRVRPGEQAKLTDLTQQMMLISDNGAARAIAEALGGSQVRFARMMNEKARAIGALRTNFVNPNGMPSENHYSTAHDIALIAAYGLKNPEFRRIVGTKESMIHYMRPAGYKTYCENTNALLYYYPGCTGLKTGWTRAARGCLAASAERGGTELIAVVMRSNDENTRAAEAAALLDYGFSYFKDGSAKE